MSEFEDKVVVTGAGGGLGKSHALELSAVPVVVNDLGSGDGVGAAIWPTRWLMKSVRPVACHRSNVGFQPGRGKPLLMTPSRNLAPSTF